MAFKLIRTTTYALEAGGVHSRNDIFKKSKDDKFLPCRKNMYLIEHSLCNQPQKCHSNVLLILNKKN